jgi:hypothetical protein
MEEMEEYRQHLDWHFRLNKKKKEATKMDTCRGWYYDLNVSTRKQIAQIDTLPHFSHDSTQVEKLSPWCMAGVGISFSRHSPNW